MISCLQRSHGDIQYLGNILIFHIIKILHIKYQTLTLRQFQHGFLQFPLDRIPTKKTITFQLIFQHGSNLLRVPISLPTLFTQKINRLIRRHPVHPCKQFRLVTKLPQPLPNLDKGILQHIIAIFMPYHDFTDMPVKPLAILSYK